MRDVRNAVRMAVEKNPFSRKRCRVITSIEAYTNTFVFEFYFFCANFAVKSNVREKEKSEFCCKTESFVVCNGELMKIISHKTSPAKMK